MSAKGKWWSATVTVENCRLSKNTFLATRPVLMHDFKQVTGPYHDSLKQMNWLSNRWYLKTSCLKSGGKKETTITKQLKNKAKQSKEPLHSSTLLPEKNPCDVEYMYKPRSSVQNIRKIWHLCDHLGINLLEREKSPKKLTVIFVGKI